jgi:Ca2+-binding EF-hand superfamily protein
LLSLALLASACASGSSTFASSDELFDNFDSDNDNTLDREEWDQTHQNMDTDGDGVVSRQEFSAAVGGGFQGGGRR